MNEYRDTFLIEKLLFAPQSLKDSLWNFLGTDWNHAVVLELLNLLRPKLDHLEPWIVLEVILRPESELVVIVVQSEVATSSTREKLLIPPIQ